jgi:peptide deformylase
VKTICIQLKYTLLRIRGEKMASPITIYGNPVLRKKAERVAEVTPELRALVDRMFGLMYSAEGIGLAAEQIGRTESLFVLDIPAGADQDSQGRPNNPGVTMPMAVFNPEIIGTSEETEGYDEGCLSFPGLQVNVVRPKEVVLRYLDRDGKEQTLNAKGLLARAIQHENDHLNGVLLVDHMSAVEKVLKAAKLKKLAKRGKSGE